MSVILCSCLVPAGCPPGPRQCVVLLPTASATDHTLPHLSYPPSRRMSSKKGGAQLASGKWQTPRAKPRAAAGE